jgi:hypothetical protein
MRAMKWQIAFLRSAWYDGLKALGRRSTMQDRSYAIAIAVILAICCLGAYVAVSGFMNTRPPSTALDLVKAITPVSVVLATQTAAPTVPGATLAPPPTSLSNPTPLGVIQTITASATMTGIIPVPTITVRPTSPPPPPSSAPQSCANYQFCPIGGPPSQDPRLVPMGILCPAAYIWGRITDRNGAGIPGARVQFKGPMGEVSQAVSKGPPDEPGIYNIPAGAIGGPYVLWMLDAGGAQASPQYTVTAPQGYSGSGNCPTRVDFRSQR